MTITVYERAGFRETGRFEHYTNGGLHAFIRMASASRPTPAWYRRPEPGPG
jgi:hypothetical protein